MSDRAVALQVVPTEVAPAPDAERGRDEQEKHLLHGVSIQNVPNNIKPWNPGAKSGAAVTVVDGFDDFAGTAA